jgi:hypothetical protein
LTGRITRLIDDQQSGTIAGEDGIDYAFRGIAFIGTTFGALHVGAAVTFEPSARSQRAESIRVVPAAPIKRPR